MKMRRSEWMKLQNTDQRTRANRKDQPKQKTGLRPFRKETQSYVDWMKDMLGMNAETGDSK